MDTIIQPAILMTIIYLKTGRRLVKKGYLSRNFLNQKKHAFVWLTWKIWQRLLQEFSPAIRSLKHQNITEPSSSEPVPWAPTCSSITALTMSQVTFAREGAGLNYAGLAVPVGRLSSEQLFDVV